MIIILSLIQEYYDLPNRFRLLFFRRNRENIINKKTNKLIRK
jgi:hypothetical protein